MELNIYSKDGSLKLTVSPSDSSTVTEEVGGECSVSVSFDTFELCAIEVNDYIEVAGVRYKARMAYRPKMRNRQAYNYSLRFYAPIHDAQQALMKTETDGGLISEFSLWGGPREHLQKWVDNMNRLAGSELWTIGSVITGENKNIDYRNVNCWDAAFGSNSIAATYETEMWADGYVINLCKCERGERVTLGYGNGLTGLTPEDNSDKVRFFTRLFPLGSTRNINVSTYGSSRLQLPSRATFVDHNTDRYGVFEDSEEDAFAGIFPQYIGTVTAVRSESKTDENGKKFTVYYIKDSGMTWEPKALPEQSFMLSFQTGDLQGYGDDTNKSFQAEWHKDTKEWEIINIWLDENTQIPGGNIVPIVGDQYFPWNMIMPQEYITEAEKRYEAAVNDFVANYSGEPVAYSGSTDYIHCAKQAVPLRIGQNVRLESDLYFEEGYQNTRITKVVRKLCRLTDATVTLSEQIGTGWKKRVDNQLSSLHYELQRQAEQASIDVIKTTDTKTPSDNNVLSALRSLKTFLRKDQSDQTNYLMKFGEFIDSLVAGKGTGIFPDGLIQTDRLEVRGSMTVMDLIINEIHAMAGDWSLSDCGAIDKVEFVSDETYKLWIRKETETDWTSLDEEDVLYSIVNNLKIGGTDYYTSWMRVVTKNINDNTLTVVLWPDSEVPGGKNYPPAAGYNVTRRGNSRIPGEGEPANERTHSWLLSSREGRIMFLQNVFKPILEDYNYGLSIGKIPKLKALKKIPVSEGELGVVAQTIITQNLYQFDYNGNVVSKRVPRGAWSLETAQGAYPYRYITKEYESENGTEYTQLEQHTVEHYGCTWGCIVDQTQDEPIWNSPGWVMIQGDQNYHLEFESSNGWQFFLNQVNTDVSAIVSYGNRDITNVLMASTGVEVEWLRDTGNVPADNSWKPTYVNDQKNVIHLSVSDMGSGWGNEYRKVSFICRVFIPVGEDFETVENRINIKI